MNTSTQQEISLITGTTFCDRLCWQNMDIETEGWSKTDLLEEACCNGMLPEILPEICMTNEKIFLWQINENHSSLQIELGEFPEIMDKRFSIDPYSFVPLHPMN